MGDPRERGVSADNSRNLEKVFRNVLRPPTKPAQSWLEGDPGTFEEARAVVMSSFSSHYDSGKLRGAITELLSRIYEGPSSSELNSIERASQAEWMAGWASERASDAGDSQGAAFFKEKSRSLAAIVEDAYYS